MRVLSILLLLAGFLSTHQASAQYDPNKVNKKAGQLYGKALDLANDDHYREAIALVQQAIEIDKNFEDAYLTLGGLFGQLREYATAIPYFEKAKQIDSVYFQEFNISYSLNLAGAGRFEEALKAIDLFLALPHLNETSRKSAEDHRQCYQFAVNYPFTRKPGDSTIRLFNLGDSINTRDAEYYPSISLDGHTLVFTRRVNDYNEDFYTSTYKDGHWSKAISLPGEINTNENEAAESPSIDGQWLIFNGCNFPGGFGSCDLYISYHTADGWSSPENMGDSLNTEFWESAPSLSPDKKDLYFSSNRPGGYGGSDIYVSHRLLNGHWSKPENLGPIINTAKDEGTPFIHADNQTLYFNSGGHPGYGNNDLFMSRKQPDGSWGTPINLGYPINTIEDEGSLVVASDGKTAYFASDRPEGKGELDLYTFQLPNDLRAAQTLWVQGKVLDKNTRKGLPSTVELTDLSTGQVISNLQTDETGNYIITLPKGKDYAFNVNRKGYLLFSENFPLSQERGDTAYNKDIPLQPIEAGAVVVLNNIFFDVDKFDLKPASRVELDKVVQLLTDNPTLRIQINGHTDNSGNPSSNLTLSANRAKSVVSYLISKGIAATRLSAKGWGDTQPIADNASAEGRTQNRRTELKVIGN